MTDKKNHVCEFNKLARRCTALQFEETGNPLRLYIFKCECGATTQRWIDASKRYEMKENDVEVVCDKEELEDDNSQNKRN